MDFLLSESAGPDGLPLYIFDNSSTFYLRGDSNRPTITMFMVRKPRSEIIQELNILQKALLTDCELEQRAKSFPFQDSGLNATDSRSNTLKEH